MGYFYRSVNVIKNAWFQSDHTKRCTLYKKSTIVSNTFTLLQSLQ